MFAIPSFLTFILIPNSFLHKSNSPVSTFGKGKYSHIVSEFNLKKNNDVHVGLDTLYNKLCILVAWL